MSRDVELSWEGGDPDGDEVTYRVYLGTTTPTVKTTWQSETTYQPYSNSLKPGESYSWKIEARDSKGEKTTGPVWHFVVAEEGDPDATPTPTPTSTPGPTPTATSTQTSTPTPGPTASATNEPENNNGDSPTETATPTATPPANGPTPTGQPDETATPTPRPTIEPDILYLGSRVSDSGLVLENIELRSNDATISLFISANTTALEDGVALNRIIILPITDSSPTESDGHIIGMTYNLLPEGAQFDPPLQLTMRYDPALLPDGISEEDLILAYFDEDANAWVEVDSEVDAEANTITGFISHFTEFGIINPQAGALYGTNRSGVAEIPWAMVGGLISAFVLMGLAAGIFFMNQSRRLALQTAIQDGSVELHVESYPVRHQVLNTWIILKASMSRFIHISSLHHELYRLLKIVVNKIRTIVKRPFWERPVPATSSNENIVASVEGMLTISQPEELVPASPSLLARLSAFVNRGTGVLVIWFDKTLYMISSTVLRSSMVLKQRFATVRSLPERRHILSAATKERGLTAEVEGEPVFIITETDEVTEVQHPCEPIEASATVQQAYGSDTLQDAVTVEFDKALPVTGKTEVVPELARKPIIDIRDFRIATMRRLSALLSRFYNYPIFMVKRLNAWTSNSIQTTKTRIRTRQKVSALQDKSAEPVDIAPAMDIYAQSNDFILQDVVSIVSDEAVPATQLTEIVTRGRKAQFTVLDKLVSRIVLTFSTGITTISHGLTTVRNRFRIREVTKVAKSHGQIEEKKVDVRTPVLDIREHRLRFTGAVAASSSKMVHLPGILLKSVTVRIGKNTSSVQVQDKPEEKIEEKPGAETKSETTVATPKQQQKPQTAAKQKTASKSDVRKERKQKRKKRSKKRSR